MRTRLYLGRVAAVSSRLSASSRSGSDGIHSWTWTKGGPPGARSVTLMRSSWIFLQPVGHGTWKPLMELYHLNPSGMRVDAGIGVAVCACTAGVLTAAFPGRSAVQLFARTAPARRAM